MPFVNLGSDLLCVSMNDQEFISLLHIHRDEHTIPLAFRPCIEKLIDSEHCRQIDQFMRNPEMKWERRTAIETLHTTLPPQKGVYMFVWRPEIEFHFDPQEVERISWILYIGKAGIDGGTDDTIKDRYQTEYSKYVGKDASCLWSDTCASTREEKLSRYLTLRPLEYWFLPLDRFAVREIALMEKQLIRLFRPPLNKQYGVTLRPGKTQPAF